MNTITRNTKRIMLFVSKAIDRIKPFIRHRKYLGYKLYYSRGTSLIERITKKGSVYEPVTCNYIIDSIKHIDNPIFIDVGSNIGLISLFVLKNKPDIKIYAFEPGPHQHMLFQQTIKSNQLSDTIELFDIAVSNRSGDSVFYVHNTKDVSGDGFLDTKRAGETDSIKVQTIDLDQWWKKYDRPQIDAIKIDTEGAELWVLEGARELISTCNPYIVTEMSNKNYNAYPYTAVEVLKIILDYNYKVSCENGEITILNDLETAQEQGIETYYCMPNKQ